MRRLISVFVLSFCLCLPAGAQTPTFAFRLLSKADANGDGDVTRQELKSFRSKEFHRLDRNGDGVVSLADVPARFKGKVKDKFDSSEIITAFDADGDKRVSRHEFENGPTLIFDRADANHDGTVSQSELVEARLGNAD